MQRIESINDERLTPYRGLKDRTLRGEDLFVAEGRALTMRLLEGPYEADSVLVDERFADEFDRLAAGKAPLYVASMALLSGLVGFNFHRGVLACGRRGKPLALDDLMTPRGDAAKLTLVVCPQVNSRENLGSILRVASAFGVDGVILGPRCCDPFSRRCLRVSMGAVFRLPIVVAADLTGDLAALRNRWGVELVATVLDDRAETLEAFRRPARLALLFGAEWDGLDPPWVAACDRRVTIPMHLGTDSLNVAVAAGIFVYEMLRRPVRP